MREFSEFEEAINYAEKQWKWFFDRYIPKDVTDNAVSFKSSGRTLKNADDYPVIMAAGAIHSVIPPFNEDVILYRGGHAEDFCDDRPFLGASFLKRVAESHAKNCDGKVFRIHVYKGARAVPICATGIRDNETECEVLIETKRLHRIGTYCWYR